LGNNGRQTDLISDSEGRSACSRSNDRGLSERPFPGLYHFGPESQHTGDRQDTPFARNFPTAQVQAARSAEATSIHSAVCPSPHQTIVQDNLHVQGKAPTLSDRKTLGDLVTEGTVTFWKPPPVAYSPRPQLAGKGRGRGKTRSSKALWHRFVEVDPTKEPGLLTLVKEGQTAMVLRSDNMVSEEDAAFDSETETPEQEPGRRTLWDRHKHRRLTFIRPFDPTDQVHYDHSIFGFPLPEMTFVRSEGKRGFLPFRSYSSWVYYHPHPTCENQVGSEPTLEECRPKVLLPTVSQTCSPRPLHLSPQALSHPVVGRATNHIVSSAMDANLVAMPIDDSATGEFPQFAHPSPVPRDVKSHDIEERGVRTQEEQSTMDTEANPRATSVCAERCPTKAVALKADNAPCGASHSDDDEVSLGSGDEGYDAASMQHVSGQFSET
jgi:hypothetical protein